LARANSIVNQTFTVSVNCGGPVGMGGSLIVGPEGEVFEEVLHAERSVLTQTLDLGEVSRVRQAGTMGTNRMWSQFTEADAPLELPLYDGRIDPERWRVAPSA
jgi:predicted amidohydrolase